MNLFIYKYQFVQSHVTNTYSKYPISLYDLLCINFHAKKANMSLSFLAHHSGDEVFLKEDEKKNRFLNCFQIYTQIDGIFHNAW